MTNCAVNGIFKEGSISSGNHPFHFRPNFSFIITSSYVLTIAQSNILSLTDCNYNFKVHVSNNITKSRLTKTENRNPLFTMYLISPFPPSQIQSMSGNNNSLSRYICTQSEHNNPWGLEPHTCSLVCPELRLTLSSRDIHPDSATQYNIVQIRSNKAWHRHHSDKFILSNLYSSLSPAIYYPQAVIPSPFCQSLPANLQPKLQI